MKRIGVISDTHGGIAAMRLCAEAAGEIDCWFHLGDHVSDATELKKLTGKPVYAVRGNCDGYGYGGSTPTELTVEIGDKRFLLIHGHKHGLDEGNLLNAVYRAAELKCDALLFGHTHAALIANQGGLLIVNPGSTRYPRDSKSPSFAVLTITDDGTLKAEIIPIRFMFF